MVGEHEVDESSSTPIVDGLAKTSEPTESKQAGNVPAGAVVSGPTGEPRKLKKSRSGSVRSFQLLILLFGLAWAAFYCPRGNLDAMQIPGFLIAMSISWWLTP